MRKSIIFFMLFLITCLGAETRRVTYQGKVTNSAGVGLDGIYDVVFKIYDDPSFGTLLHEVTVTDVPVDRGLLSCYFNLELTPEELAEDMYLEVVFDGDRLLPRMLVTSEIMSFYSTFSHSADEADSSTIAAASYYTDVADSARISGIAYYSDFADTARISAFSDHATNADSSFKAAIAHHSYHTDQADTSQFTFLSEFTDSSRISARAHLADSATALNWGDLRAIPADIADGDDGGFYRIRFQDGVYFTDSLRVREGANISFIEYGNNVEIHANIPGDLLDGDDEGIARAKVAGESYITDSLIFVAGDYIALGQAGREITISTDLPEEITNGDDEGVQRLRAGGYSWLGDSATFVGSDRVTVSQRGDSIQIDFSADSNYIYAQDTLEQRTGFFVAGPGKVGGGDRDEARTLQYGSMDGSTKDYPLAGDEPYFRSIMLVEASEMDLMGGVLAGLQLSVNTTPILNFIHADFDIWILQTVDSSVPALWDITGAKNVKSSTAFTIPFEASGWFDIAFDDTVHYDGTSNLMIFIQGRTAPAFIPTPAVTYHYSAMPTDAYMAYSHGSGGYTDLMNTTTNRSDLGLIFDPAQWHIDGVVLDEGVITLDGDIEAGGDINGGSFTLDGSTITAWNDIEDYIHTIYDTLEGVRHDTIVVNDDMKIIGELIADSIQAVGPTIEMDDSVLVKGNLTAMNNVKATNIIATQNVTANNNLSVNNNATVTNDLFVLGTIHGSLAASVGYAIDTLRTIDNVREDTLVIFSNAKVHGELIADSIQAVADTVHMDDNLRVYGGIRAEDRMVISQTTTGTDQALGIMSQGISDAAIVGDFSAQGIHAEAQWTGAEDLTGLIAGGSFGAIPGSGINAFGSVNMSAEANTASNIGALGWAYNGASDIGLFAASNYASLAGAMSDAPAADIAVLGLQNGTGYAGYFMGDVEMTGMLGVGTTASTYSMEIVGDRGISTSNTASPTPTGGDYVVNRYDANITSTDDITNLYMTTTGSTSDKVRGLLAETYGDGSYAISISSSGFYNGVNTDPDPAAMPEATGAVGFGRVSGGTLAAKAIGVMGASADAQVGNNYGVIGVAGQASQSNIAVLGAASATPTQIYSRTGGATGVGVYAYNPVGDAFKADGPSELTDNVRLTGSTAADRQIRFGDADEATISEAATGAGSTDLYIGNARILVDGGTGTLPTTATADQTIRWEDGTGWVANSALTNDGTDIALSGALDVTGMSTFGDAVTVTGRAAATEVTTGTDKAIGVVGTGRSDGTTTGDAIAKGVQGVAEWTGTEDLTQALYGVEGFTLPGDGVTAFSVAGWAIQPNTGINTGALGVSSNGANNHGILGATGYTAIDALKTDLPDVNSAITGVQNSANPTDYAGYFNGRVHISDKATSASTLPGDNAQTLTTKDYVDAQTGTTSTDIDAEIHVSKNGDDGTGDGSLEKPYLTINKAVTEAAILDATHTFVTIIVHTGEYNETVTLEDVALENLRIVGVGTVNIEPTVGNAFQSTTNNDNLAKLKVENITFGAPFVITGSNGAASFGDVVFDGCNWVTGNGGLHGTIDITCVNNFTVKNAYITETCTFNNLNWAWFESSQLQGDITFANDGTANAPAWGADGAQLWNGVYFSGTPTFTPANGASFTLAANGGRIGGSTDVTLPAGATVFAYNSYLRSQWTVDGTLNLRGSFVQGGIDPASTGTVNYEQFDAQIANTSSVPGATIKDALDAIDNSLGFDTLFANLKADPTDTIVAYDNVEVVGQLAATQSTSGGTDRATGLIGSARTDVDGGGVNSATGVYGWARWTGAEDLTQSIAGVVGETAPGSGANAMGAMGTAVNVNTGINAGVAGFANQGVKDIGVVGVSNYADYSVAMAAAPVGDVAVLGLQSGTGLTDYAGYFDGKVNVTGKVTSASTEALDDAQTLTTKDYVDAQILAGGADNLGDHTATADLDMATYNVAGADSIEANTMTLAGTSTDGYHLILGSHADASPAYPWTLVDGALTLDQEFVGTEELSGVITQLTLEHPNTGGTGPTSVRGHVAKVDVTSDANMTGFIAGADNSVWGNGTGIITNAYGTRSLIKNTAATSDMTNAFGAWTKVFNTNGAGGGGNIAHAYGNYIDTPVNDGTINNYYGLYINDLSSLTTTANKFAIYVAGGRTRLGGDTQITGNATVNGVSNFLDEVNINSDATVAGDLQVITNATIFGNLNVMGTIFGDVEVADTSYTFDTLKTIGRNPADTLVINAQTKIVGELIADSLQAAGDTIFMDDLVKVNGKVHSDTTVAADEKTVLTTKSYVDAAIVAGGADNLGDHTATQDLDMDSWAIVNVGDLTVDGSATFNTKVTATDIGTAEDGVNFGAIGVDGLADWDGAETLTETIAGIHGRTDPGLGVDAIGIYGESGMSNTGINMGAAGMAYQGLNDFGIVGASNYTSWDLAMDAAPAVDAAVLGLQSGSTATDFAGYFGGDVKVTSMLGIGVTATTYPLEIVADRGIMSTNTVSPTPTGGAYFVNRIDGDITTTDDITNVYITTDGSTSNKVRGLLSETRGDGDYSLAVSASGFYEGANTSVVPADMPEATGLVGFGRITTGTLSARAIGAMGASTDPQTGNNYGVIGAAAQAGNSNIGVVGAANCTSNQLIALTGGALGVGVYAYNPAGGDALYVDGPSHLTGAVTLDDKATSSATEDGDGATTLTTKGWVEAKIAAGVDNLGNHTATMDLDLDANNIVNGANITSDRFTATGTAEGYHFVAGSHHDASPLLEDAVFDGGIGYTDAYSGTENLYAHAVQSWLEHSSGNGPAKLRSSYITATTEGTRPSPSVATIENILTHNSTGQLTNGYGVKSLVTNTNTNGIANAYGIHSQIKNENAGGTVLNAYGLYVATPVATGTINTAYGLYVNTQNAAATNYGIYVAGGQSYFGADVDVNGKVTSTATDDGDGATTLTTKGWVEAKLAAVPDDMGDHTATTTLDMNGNSIVNADDITTTGTITIGEFLTVEQGTQTVNSFATLTPTKSYYKVEGNGGAVSFNATTAIADGTTAGQVLILEGNHDTNSVQLPDNANTKLDGSFTIGNGDSIMLIWNGADWIEISRSNN